MSATIELIVPSTVTRKVENLMVLSPLTSSLPKLLLKPGRWTVGSAATCSYRIAAEGVRPRHALLLCGSQTTLLKAWDANTWHNGQPVRGEVRLQQGDHVTVGSVEFSLESAGTSDVLAQLPDVPREVVSRLPSPASAPKESDVWDMEDVRAQIQELRDELSQRVTQQPPPFPVAAPHPDVEKMSARVAELEQSAGEARQLAEQTQQELAAVRAEQAQRHTEWQHDREQLLAEIAGRERNWEQQVNAWNSEREQHQNELASLTNGRQQLAAEFEQRLSALQSEATRWQAEYEQLQADRQQQQSAWAAEHARLLEESLRQEDIAQQALHTSAQYQQELAEHSQQLLAARQQIEAERQQIETERQQIQAARLESEQTLAELEAERQRVATLASEAQSQVEDITRRLTEFEQQQSQLTRDQRVLEHSWNWVQSDRRKLVEEKEQWQQQCADWQAEREGWHAERANWQAERQTWQAEREQLQRALDEFSATYELKRDDHAAIQQLADDREQFEAERTVWQQQREQWELEQQANSEQLEAACAELQEQQRALADEQAQLQTQRTEWETRAAEIEIERQSLDARRQTLTEECQAWEDQRAAWETHRLPEPMPESVPAPEPEQPLALTEAPLQTLQDTWSIGVDLTAPRETHIAEQPTETFDNSEILHSDSPTTDCSPTPRESVDMEISSNPPEHQSWSNSDSELLQSPANSDWTTSDWTHPQADVITPTQLGPSDVDSPAADWDSPLPLPSRANFVDAAETLAPASETLLDNSPRTTWETNQLSSFETLDPATAALRRELAEKFQMPGLCSTLPVTSNANEPVLNDELATDESTATEWKTDEPASAELPSDEPASEVFESAPVAAEQLASDTPIDDTPIDDKSTDVEPTEAPSSIPVSSTLESLQFSEDENIDDSVSRYMQNLLARSQRNSGANAEQLAPPAKPVKSLGKEPPSSTVGTTPVTSPTTAGESSPTADAIAPVDDSSNSLETVASPTEPVHRQNKDAIRAATEQMRQIANQQTLKNVQESNWSRLKQSIKTKSCLAAFAFVLSCGLLFLGYYYKQEFFVLGACAAGLGVVTWLDLFIAIREARKRTAQLAGRKKDA